MVLSSSIIMETLVFSSFFLPALSSSPLLPRFSAASALLLDRFRASSRSLPRFFPIASALLSFAPALLHRYPASLLLSAHLVSRESGLEPFLTSTGGDTPDGTKSKMLIEEMKRLGKEI